MFGSPRNSPNEKMLRYCVNRALIFRRIVPEINLIYECHIILGLIHNHRRRLYAGASVKCPGSLGTTDD